MSQSRPKQPVDYDLTCWYLNARRVIELIRVNSISADLQNIASLDAIDDAMRKNVTLSILKDGVTRWLRATNPPTLGQLLISNELRPGSLFTFYTNYFFKGLSKVSEALRKGKTTIPMAEGYAKLDEFRANGRIQFQFSHEHLTSSSAWGELSGQKRLLLLGAVKDMSGDVIQALPWVIANPIPDLFEPQTVIGSHWYNRLEIFADQIDNFERVRELDYRPSKTDLSLLQPIPEASIKQAFAEIIGEPSVPKDWGGERSDLFTTAVALGGKRVSTAIAFKGPAKFHPMTVADLGKNGDQIDRLFTEPADLFILQHCHEITQPVRGMMRAYAQQMGRPKLFCLISGYDTLRILKAYGRCGLS
jgi:hypothetical protein